MLCETLVNNMSEAFNSVIVTTRSKPTINMLENIITYIMERWANKILHIASFE